MLKTVYVCDHCGIEIGQGEETTTFGHDFCPGCLEELTALIDDWVQAQALRKIDWGKAQALRDAGWTPTQIGEEIGAPRQLVSKHTTPPPKKQKKYENEFNSEAPAIMRSAQLI